VDGGNGLAMAMAGEHGYVENQVAFGFGFFSCFCFLKR